MKVIVRTFRKQSEAPDNAAQQARDRIRDNDWQIAAHDAIGNPAQVPNKQNRVTPRRNSLCRFRFNNFDGLRYIGHRNKCGGRKSDNLREIH